MNDADRLSIDFSGLKLDNSEEDAETWLCDAGEDVHDGPATGSFDCATQSSNELLEWLNGSTSSIDYRTKSALSRKVKNHAIKKERAKLKTPVDEKLFDVREDDELCDGDVTPLPTVEVYDKVLEEEDEDDEFYDAREELSDSSFDSPRVAPVPLNTVDEVTPTATPAPGHYLSPGHHVSPALHVAPLITPKRPNVTAARTRKDSAPLYSSGSSPSAAYITPKQPNVNVKMRSASTTRPPTAVVAPNKKAMTEPPRPATSLSRRAPATTMSTSFSQSNSRENSFQKPSGFIGDLYRSQFENLTIEQIEDMAKMQEQMLLREMEEKAKERKTSFHHETPSSRPGTAEGHLATSRSVDFNARLSPQPSLNNHFTLSRLPAPKARTGIPQPSSRLPMPSKLKTPLRTIAGGGYGSPADAPIRRKSTEMVKQSSQPLSTFQKFGANLSAGPDYAHGRGNRQVNGVDDWNDDCF
ncbi:hypothetical protein L596_023865 [Steinernema carpocapsae]|uniref:Uncharacterized protein n=1 Tax=Steinernema carpocapsae TaxID=34508 RepID=A0A4U5MF03_STECR|nr:hypothetical protein L596_023865 [Steinernema carpocapsae]